MKPKIVQVTAIGMSQVKLLSTLNDTLIINGYEVHRVYTPDDYSQRKEKNAIHDHEINIDRSIKPISNLKTIKDMVKIFNEVKPDIVHVHTPVAAILGRIAAKIAKAPHIVYTAHGFYFHEGMNQRSYTLFYNIEKYAGRMLTDQIFTQSKEDYDLAVKGKFLRNNQYLHISNGVDLESKFNFKMMDEKEVQSVRNKLNIKENDIVFSFLGRMVREKGIIELLNAFSIVSEEYSNIKLICIGSLPSSERDSSTLRLLDKFKMSDKIHFLGEVNRPELYYYLSDIFVLPSYREGMPRSIIEAMAMKNAIIATNIRGSREEVEHRENGYLVDVKSISDIVEAMRYLIENPNKIQSMKEKSYQKALREYNEKDVVEKQIKVFNEMLGRN